MYKSPFHFLICLLSLCFEISCVTNPRNQDSLQKKYHLTKLELAEANRLLDISVKERRKEAFRSDGIRRQNRDLTASLLAAHISKEKSQDRLLRRNRILKSYIERIRSKFSLDFLEVSIIKGQLHLRLPSDVLFPSGSAQISKQGSKDLFEIAEILSNQPENSFQIQGHTDSDPIKGGPYKTNWHLGYSRAMSVLNVFQSAGIDQANISAASFGEFNPRDSNQTAKGKAKNRRIEIVMVPDLSLFIADPI